MTGRRPAIDEAEFCELYRTIGPTRMAEQTGMTVRGIAARRQRIEGRTGVPIHAPPNHVTRKLDRVQQSGVDRRVQFMADEALILVGSDAHFWPHRVTTAWKGFVWMARELQPDAIVWNGDMLDGARISRFPAGDQWTPSLQEELDVLHERDREIREAAPNAKYLWCVGNHDLRLVHALGKGSDELTRLQGVGLDDWFPHWQFGWSVWINDDVTIKHRFKGGKYAVANNTLHSGVSMVTGHMHSLNVWRHTDYRGHRWGVDCGTLAEPYGSQFDYAEDNPRDWASGFVLLTIRGGRLIWPEVVLAEDGHILWRGTHYAMDSY